MNKKLCISKKIKGIDARVDYYLTEGRYTDVKNGISTYIFGVEIQKVTEDESGTELVQKKCVKDLTVSMGKALEFLYLLAENDTLPVGFKDIAEDFAGEGFFHLTGGEKKTA